MKCYSEVNKQFVSNPNPTINEKVEIAIVIQHDAPVEKVLLRAIIDGSHKTFDMECAETNGSKKRYTTSVVMTQPVINYHFIIVSDKKLYYYNRYKIYDYTPTEDYDFVLLADFQNPTWINSSVFYQIFPDRFRTSSHDFHVKTDEYTFDGESTIAVEWDTAPLPYDKGHCLDFYGGDLYGIIDAIPYLKELGVNAIYINPIFEAKTHHRYDCTDYFKVDPHLGGDKGFEKLCKALHDAGIRIVVDVSINHTGIAHPWVTDAIKNRSSETREFYYFTDDTNKPATWLGVHTLPQLNYNSEKLRQTIYKGEDSFMKKWLKAPFNIDGYRYDVGNNTARRHTDQLSNDIFKEVRQSVKSTQKDAYIVGEHWKDYISYVQGGDQWDAAMNYFGSGRPLRCFAGETDRFSRHLLKDPGAPGGYTGEQVVNIIQTHLARIPNQLVHLQFNLIDSHDIHRFHNNKNVFDFDIYRGIIILLGCLPGTFSIYYGDEIGLDGSIDTVENARYPMQWDETKWNREFLDLYKTVIKTKKENKALHQGSYVFIYADEDTVVLLRAFKKDVVLAVMYKGDKAKEISLDLSLYVDSNVQFTEAFTSEAFTTVDNTLNLCLKPKQSLMLIS